MTQTNPMSFFLCKKKIRKKRKKAALFFPLVFGGDRSRLSLSLSLETLSSPSSSSSSSSRRHSGAIIVSSVGTVASGGVGVLPLFSTPARAPPPPPPPRRSKMLPENESKNRIAFWTRIILLLLYGTRKNECWSSLF